MDKDRPAGAGLGDSNVRGDQFFPVAFMVN
jgi:hypothetical protein